MTTYRPTFPPLRLSGTLTIEGTITSLPVFDALTTVAENIFLEAITTETITSLAGGFPSLGIIQGGLIIRNNEFIQTISPEAFPLLKRVLFGIDIVSNNSLQRITEDEFPLLDEVGRDLHIRGNNSLETISGFVQLDRIGGALAIREHPRLHTISGFEELDEHRLQLIDSR